jgi:hypothetical protein
MGREALLGLRLAHEASVFPWPSHSWLDTALSWPAQGRKDLEILAKASALACDSIRAGPCSGLEVAWPLVSLGTMLFQALVLKSLQSHPQKNKTCFVS